MEFSRLPLIRSIDQLGFVVDDIEAAALHWGETCGVGPFFVRDNIHHKSFTYRGQPTSVELTLAFSYVGSTQIELIHQKNNAPSVYVDLLARSDGGLVHVAEFCDDLDGRISAWPEVAILQTSVSHYGAETVYFDTRHHSGGLIELIKGDAAHKERRRMMQEAAMGWDGTDPIRVL